MRAKNIFILFISLLFVYVGAFFSVFESGDLPLIVVLESGLITQGVPVNPHGYTTYFLLSEIFTFLYAHIPNVPWYECIVFFYESISLFIILSVLLRKNRDIGTIPKLLLLMVVLALYTELVLFMQYTRVAFSFGLASTLLLIAMPEDKKIHRWLSAILFVFCALTRWEAGLFTLVVQLLAAFFLYKKNIYKTSLIANCVVAVLLMAYIAVDRITTTEYTKQFQPELGYQLLDRGNIVPLGTMKNAVDSTKYIAVKNMISDPEYITIGFLQSLVRENAFWGGDQDLVNRLWTLFVNSITNALGLFIIYMCVFLYVLFNFLLDRERKAALYYMLFNASIWLFLVVIMYLIKMEVWLFTSVLVSLCIISISVLDLGKLKGRTVLNVLGILAISIGGYRYFEDHSNYSSNFRKQIDRNVKFADEVKKKCSGSILVPDITFAQSILIQKYPFGALDYSMFDRFYLFDMDVLYLEKNYNAYLRKECNCNASDYVEFMEFLYANKSKVKFISRPERMSVIHDYCSIVRGRDYQFHAQDSIPYDGEQAYIYVFE